MNDLINSKNRTTIALKEQKKSQFSESGLYVKEDDQDWGKRWYERHSKRLRIKSIFFP